MIWLRSLFGRLRAWWASADTRRGGGWDAHDEEHY